MAWTQEKIEAVATVVAWLLLMTMPAGTLSALAAGALRAIWCAIVARTVKFSLSRNGLFSIVLLAWVTCRNCRQRTRARPTKKAPTSTSESPSGASRTHQSATTTRTPSSLLGRIDAERKALGKRPKFRRRYNEKWLTIRALLTGHSSRGVHADDELVSVIRARFAEILSAFKNRVKGKGRYAMINYSFLFRRIFDLYGLNWYSLDFPPLKTPEKRRKNVQLWVECCRDTGYPYINTDSLVFPAVNFYQPVPWLTIYDGLTSAGQRAARGGREYQFGRGRKRSREAIDRRFDKSVKRWIQRYVDAEGAHPGARRTKL
jgi:hypothetical protein